MGALTTFPCKLRQKDFSALGMHVHTPTAPPGYAYITMVGEDDGSQSSVKYMYR